MLTGTPIRVVAAAAVLAAVATCAARPNQDSGPAGVRVGVVVPRESSPAGQVVGLTYLTSALVGETLFSVDNAGRFQPRLVETWQRSDDGRVWTFTLKRGVTLHNGTALTSALVVEAIRRQLGAFAGATSVVALDEWSFRIEQARASSFLLDGLVNVGINNVDGTRTGTGPFVLSPREGDTVTFRAFDAYHRGAPTVREIGLLQYADQRNAWSALMRSEIDVLYEVSPEAREFVETESTVAVSSFVRPYTQLLGFNLTDPRFQDRRVRRAMNLAIDRDSVITTALKGHARPAFDHLWPRHWAVDATRSSYPADKTAALRLLEASGRVSLQPSSEHRMPSRLAFECIVYEPLEKVALAVQRELATIDVDMTIQLLSAPQMGQRIATGQYEAFLFELTNARMLGFTYLFWHSESEANVRTGYSAADEALDRVRYARGDTEIRAAVQAVQDVMRDDPPAVFLAYPEVARAVSRRFVIPPGEEDIFHTIARWAPARPASRLTPDIP